MRKLNELPFPELVEGQSCLFINISYEVQPFDRLRERGQPRFTTPVSHHDFTRWSSTVAKPVTSRHDRSPRPIQKKE